MSPGGISVLERGIRRTPQRDTVAQLADALALSAADRKRLEAAAAHIALRETLQEDEIAQRSAEGATWDEDRAVREALKI